MNKSWWTPNSKDWGLLDKKENSVWLFQMGGDKDQYYNSTVYSIIGEKQYYNLKIF